MPNVRPSFSTALMLLVLTASCDRSPSGSSGPGAAAAIVAATPTSIDATVGDVVPLAVRVTSAAGQGVPNISVSFAVTAGGGSIAPPTVTTDANGVASSNWTLGTTVGQNRLIATAAQLPPVDFTAAANAGDPASMSRIGGHDQSAWTGGELASPLVIRIADTYGNPVPQAPVTWSAAAGNGTLHPYQPLTDADGQAQARWVLGGAEGPQTAEAQYEGSLRATFEATAEAIQNWADYAQLFPYEVSRSSLLVRSDIGLSFSEQHLDFLERTWSYYSRVIGDSPGDGTTIHYTTDSTRYVLHGPLCPHIGTVPWYPGARQASACWDTPDPGRWTWVIIPYQQPDLGTILHEIGHTFTQVIYPEQESFPWFKEGTGMYWEGGMFDASGDLKVDSPAPYLRSGFRQWSEAGLLVPLPELLTMSRDTFYGSDWTQVYSQAGMFVYYLMKSHQSMMTEIFADMRAGAIVSNPQLLEAITAGTDMGLSELEQAYIALARSFPP